MNKSSHTSLKQTFVLLSAFGMMMLVSLGCEYSAVVDTMNQNASETAQVFGTGTARAIDHNYLNIASTAIADQEGAQNAATNAVANVTLAAVTEHAPVYGTQAAGSCQNLVDNIEASDYSAIQPAASLPGCDFSNVDLYGMNLTLADLRSVNLNRANLTGANLGGADMRFAVLSQTNLRFADLTMTNLTDADMRGADLTGAILIGTDLTRANITGEQLMEAAHVENVLLPEGVVYPIPTITPTPTLSPTPTVSPTPTED